MGPKFTIAIPTYNRAALLEKRLEELLPQVKDRPQVALCVFDDASTDTTPQVLERYRSFLTVVDRSAANRGIGGNMLRAFEAAGAGWLWTLGDDDPVAPDAVTTALELIGRHPEALTINCDSEGGRNPREYSVHNLPELLAEKEIADLLFMSSNLYNLGVLGRRAKVLYQSLGTLAPHLALMLSALENSGRPLVFSRRQLTLFHHREQRWSSLEAAVGLAYMPLFIRDQSLQTMVARSARRVTRWMLRYGLRKVTDEAGFRRWQCYMRMVNRMLDSQGAGLLTDLGPSRTGESMLNRLAPEILSRMPYFLARSKALRMHSAHAGDTVLLDNSVASSPTA